MGFVSGTPQDRNRVPVLEDLPELAEKSVLVRATFERPLAADPMVPLALRRAQGLAETLEWLIGRGARVTVVGGLEGVDGSEEAEHLVRIRNAIASLSPTVGRSAAVDYRSCTEDETTIGALVLRHDLFVNDSLQASMWPLPSVIVPAQHLVSAVGRTLQDDLEAIDGLLERPHRPFVAVLGGERSLARLRGLEGLVLRADTVLLGGALALPMLQAIGRQPLDGVSEDFLWECRSVYGLSARVRHQIMLPLDLVWSTPGGVLEVAPVAQRPRGQVVDVGPQTRVRFSEVLQGAGAILWAGALGKVEEPASCEGTLSVAPSVAGSATVLVGGDALVGLLDGRGLLSENARVLSATDAAIELLKNGDLPALAALRRT